MQKQRIHNKNSSLKPAMIGGFLILIIIALFFSKNFLFKKDKKEDNEQIQKNKVTKEISVPMILPEDLQKLISNNTHLLIDIRNAEDFKYNHIEKSQNIPINELKNQSKEFNKTVPIIIIDQIETPQGKEATQYLNNVNLSAKYLIGGIERFSNEGYSVISFGDPNLITDIAKVIPLSPKEVNQKVIDEFGLVKFLDVRPRSQFSTYKIENSINIPLEEIEYKKEDIPIGRIIVVDEDPIRSFQASVRLNDMNFIEVYCLKTSLNNFKKYIEESNSTANSEKEKSSNEEN